jgi:hypothetical protein
MAIIGARPAPTPWFGLVRRRPTRRGRPSSARRGRSARSLATRIRARADVRPLLVAIVIAAGLALFYLSQSTSVAARGYQVDSLEDVLANRIAEQQQLLLDIGRARSPIVIAERARRDLDLVPLAPDAISFAPARGASGH